MEPNQIKNILWHFVKTGNASMITVPNIFSKEVQGGVFYKNSEQWLCCGGFKNYGKTLMFGAWIADTTEKFINGVPVNTEFKILLFENNQWQELKITSATNQLKRVVDCFDGLKAKPFEYLNVEGANDMILEPTEIMPSVNPALLQEPQIFLKDIYEFTSVSKYRSRPRNFSIKPIFHFCTYKSILIEEKPSYILGARMGKGSELIIDNDLLKIKAMSGEPDFVRIKIFAIPFNVDFEEITETALVKINHKI